MVTPPNTCHRNSPRPNAGSALLLTILTVSILLLLSLAMVSFVRLELRGVENHLKLLQARANARLGAEMALARLQEWTGPDQRVTVRAEMWDGTVANRSRPGTIHPAGKRRWVGVWDSRSFNETSPTAKTFLGWLVSSGSPSVALAENDPPPGASDPNAVTLVGPGSVSAPTDHIRGRLVRWADDTNAYAWMADDNGLKAQLAAQVRNDLPGDPPGGGVIPGAYPLEGLPGLGGLAGVDPGEYSRLNSTRDLPFLGAAAGVVPAKFYDYSTFSRGVLADVKNGGLKKDLTIAFENDTVFGRVFPTTDTERYLLLDPDKLGVANDLRANGYIHWNMFKDYYNLKRHIFRRSGQDLIDTVYFGKNNIITGTHPISLGTLPPHEMGASRNPTHHREQPYGDLVATYGMDWDQPRSKHNHLGPILSRLHQSAWLEYTPPANPGNSARLTTRVQQWTSHYNPYNIGLIVRGPAHGGEAGPRLHNYPQVFFHVPGVSAGNFNSSPGQAGLTGTRETNARNPPLISPGMSQVYGVEVDATSGTFHNVGPFGPNIRNNISANLHNTIHLSEPLEGEKDVTVTFRIERNGSNSLTHGADMHPVRTPTGSSVSHDMEVTQVFHTPFAWNAGSGHPEKILMDRMTPDEFANRKFGAGFFLRSTRESGGAFRPLIDANIRAPWVNPRWDSPLNLSTMAGYSEQDNGEIMDEFPQMQGGPEGTGFTYMGAATEPPDGSPRVILFDIPREDLVSIGQLQHTGAGRFSYEPSYIVGNSYANPRIPLDQWREGIRDTFSTRHQLLHAISGTFQLYDASYLVNQRMWDRHVFTTLPQMDDNDPGTITPSNPNYASLLARNTLLPNPRFLPYQPQGLAFDATTLKDEGNANGTRGSFHHNAGFLLVDGAFNVNSTSADAWEAFLSGTLELPVQRVDANGLITGFTPTAPDRIRFPRVKASFGDGMDTEALDENYWTGFRALKQTEVRALAEAIVREVKSRGPFLNMAEFVNRSLVNGALGHAGPLQAALDATVNKDLDNDFERAAPASPGVSTQGAGFPGQLLQGDLLQALSPLMSVRSDTFTIRSYGELKTPGGTRTEAKAWCEVVVQRLPDPVVNTTTAPQGADLLARLAAPATPWGRRFQVISFRWLAEDEI